MKESTSSCSVVGALIVTIMFAAAFTVPGGNDQTSGYPVFLKEKLFIVFRNFSCTIIVFFYNFCTHIFGNPQLSLCRRRFPLFLTNKIDNRPFYTFSLHCNYDAGFLNYHCYDVATKITHMDCFPYHYVCQCSCHSFCVITIPSSCSNHFFYFFSSHLQKEEM